MKGQHVLRLVGILALAALPVSGVALAQGPGLWVITAAVGAAFYQGRLLNGGNRRRHLWLIRCPERR